MIEIQTEQYELVTPKGVIKTITKLFSVKYQETELFSQWITNRNHDDYTPPIEKTNFEDIISRGLMIPLNKLRLSFSSEYQGEKIEIPYEMKSGIR